MPVKGKTHASLIINVFILLIVGIMMVTSASMPYAELILENKWHFVTRELIWIGMALVACVIFLRLPMKLISGFSFSGLVIACVMLILVAFTPLGQEINGAKRWLGVGSFTFSPSDFAKIAVTLWMAKYLSLNHKKLSDWHTLLVPGAVTVVICGLILAQPDLGTAVTIAGTVFAMIVVAGIPLKTIGVVACGGVGIVGIMIAVEPYRLKRLMTFIHPMDDPLGDGYQILHSLYALGSGGIFGVGYQASKQKLMYLPESYTDFIFSVIGEEFGLVGCILVGMLFLWFFVNGMKIAKRVNDPFMFMLAVGLTTVIVLQAFINMIVAAGGCPVTGITLPFISYGGTSLLTCMISTGILLNISRYSGK